MKLPIFQIDAFTTTAFQGNPAAVVLLEEELSAATLQAIASENNLSETAFVQIRSQPFGLRWFTPVLEVDLCGHATLASAFVLFQEGIANGASIRFSTLSGILEVSSDGSLLWMDFPSRPPVPVSCGEELAAALGKRPRQVLQARDLMAVFSTEEEVVALRPDFQRLESLDAFAVIATARGDSVDFVSRFFAPRAGVPEDPVTGSAHCTLIPFWSRTLGRTRLLARQVSRRGGELVCEDRGDRVLIGGQAVEYLRGQISIPVPAQKI